MRTMTSPERDTPPWNGLFAILVAAAVFSLVVPATPVHGQTGHVVAQANPAVTYRPEDRPPVNSEALSCSQLKADVQKAGGLSILSEPKRWPETYYGPEVPQCDPWSRPLYSYVKANDGACGVGYICTPRVTGGR